MRWSRTTSSAGCCSPLGSRKSCPPFLNRREGPAERRATHIAELRKRVTEVDVKLRRLYDAIENGVADLADPS
ncbi:MAG: hypothetical protein J0J01_30805 [Reyranella sp.]|uniref:hypothetical protein n=1 Tax=Reyranella sp. TaxID=1929291 RepID=UPI001ACEEB92|nr:hypothetical protein [Reyranella sp.]MBN9091330.1 hypothetical protein [Reyranella sp.]